MPGSRRGYDDDDGHREYSWPSFRRARVTGMGTPEKVPFFIILIVIGGEFARKRNSRRVRAGPNQSPPSRHSTMLSLGERRRLRQMESGSMI